MRLAISCHRATPGSCYVAPFATKPKTNKGALIAKQKQHPIKNKLPHRLLFATSTEARSGGADYSRRPRAAAERVSPRSGGRLRGTKLVCYAQSVVTSHYFFSSNNVASSSCHTSVAVDLVHRIFERKLYASADDGVTVERRHRVMLHGCSVNWCFWPRSSSIIRMEPRSLFSIACLP